MLFCAVLLLFCVSRCSSLLLCVAGCCSVLFYCCSVLLDAVHDCSVLLYVILCLFFAFAKWGSVLFCVAGCCLCWFKLLKNINFSQKKTFFFSQMGIIKGRLESWCQFEQTFLYSTDTQVK